MRRISRKQAHWSMRWSKRAPLQSAVVTERQLSTLSGPSKGTYSPAVIAEGATKTIWVAGHTDAVDDARDAQRNHRLYHDRARYAWRRHLVDRENCIDAEYGSEVPDRTTRWHSRWCFSTPAERDVARAFLENLQLWPRWPALEQVIARQRRATTGGAAASC
jgi:hypothetical protein